MSKDYYKILEVEKTADKAGLKAAFRKLAHKHHPDKGGDEAKFKEINEAYQVLSDDQKRSQYDQFGQTFDGASGHPGGGGFSGNFGGMNFEDLGDVFGDMFGGSFGGRSKRAQGQDILVDLDISFKDSVFGVQKEISLSKKNSCERCGGVRAEPGTKLKTCKTCKGNGYVTAIQRTILGAMQSKRACTDCQSSGEIPETKCRDCGGEGTSFGAKTIRVDVPAGVEDGMRIRLRNEGESIGSSGDSGDLYIRLHVGQDKRFEREGNNLYTIKKIGFTQAALGDEVEVEAVDKSVKLNIPKGIQSGEKLRLKGLGVQSSGRAGDLYVVVQIITPKKLNRQQKKLMEELDLKED